MPEDLGTIRNHVISYFAWRFNRPPGDFKGGTRVRNAFRNDEAWAALADTFNSMPWMQAIGVMLSQNDMGDVATIGELATLINSKVRSDARKLQGTEFQRVAVRNWPL